MTATPTFLTYEEVAERANLTREYVKELIRVLKVERKNAPNPRVGIQGQRAEMSLVNWEDFQQKREEMSVLGKSPADNRKKYKDYGAIEEDDDDTVAEDDSMLNFWYSIEAKPDIPRLRALHKRLLAHYANNRAISEVAYIKYPSAMYELLVAHKLIKKSKLDKLDPFSTDCVVKQGRASSMGNEYTAVIEKGEDS